MTDPELSNRDENVVNLILPDLGPTPSLATRIRESVALWPNVDLNIRLMPWNWRIKPWWYRDDLDPTYIKAAWLMFEVEIAAEHGPMFPWLS
jgi:hypothetical protein